MRQLPYHVLTRRMKVSATIFERYEKKYLLTLQQQALLLELLTTNLVPDEYGAYALSNIYYDTSSFELIRSSLEKPVYKEKLRLRSYGTPDKGDIVFIELKKKFDGIVYKRRLPLSYHEDAEVLRGDLLRSEEQVAREIGFFLSQYEVSAKAFICYDRIAFKEVNHPDVRITFDSNIRFRQTDLSLAAGAWGETLLSPDQVLMEIKIPGAFPLYLSRILSDMGIHSVSFSKYGNCFQQFVLPSYYHETRKISCSIS